MENDESTFLIMLRNHSRTNDADYQSRLEADPQRFISNETRRILGGFTMECDEIPWSNAPKDATKGCVEVLLNLKHQVDRILRASKEACMKNYRR